MKILEVKNNLVKISYTAQDNLVLSGFVIIEDSKQPYVAQVMSLKAESGLNYAIVKLLFTFNEEGVVKNYNGTIPELNASITRLSSDELLDILPIEKPVKAGKLAQQNFLLNIDYSVFEKNLLICSDKVENTDIMLSNIAKQITENDDKSVIFDTDATINAENSLVFGRDFKLPLNYDTINFIYENDLTDVSPESKAVIQDIFLEVQEYSRTVLDQFIPFDNFISVVEAQYRETNIPELALLKSRLLKYKEESVFAQNAKEIHSLRAAIRGNMSTLLDISRADDKLQKLIISYVYDEISAMDLFVYSLVKINNDNADKKLIRKFFSQNKIYTIIAAPHNYKYLYELKDRASNMCLFAPQTMQHDFASYNIFLNKLNDDECIVYGKATQNIPLIIEVMPLEDLDASIVPEEEPQAATDEQEPEVPKDDFAEDSNSYPMESMINDTPAQPAEEKLEELPVSEPESLVDLPQIDEPVQPALEEIQEPEATEESDNSISMETIDDSEEIVEPEQVEEEFSAVEMPNLESDLQSEDYTLNEEDLTLPVLDDEQLTEPMLDEELPAIEEEADNNSDSMVNTDDSDYVEEEQPQLEYSEESIAEVEEVQPQFEEPEENAMEPLEEEAFPADDIAEAPEPVLQEEETLDIPEELPALEPAEEVVEEASEREVIENMDGSLDELLPDLPEIEEINEPEAPKQDNLTEDDLDFIQGMNLLEENNEVDTELNDKVQDEQPQVVPVYPAEEMSTGSSADNFEAGDRVFHPKYGEGVVEKMIKYGNKILCSISFEGGRRLLDPAISDIRKM